MSSKFEARVSIIVPVYQVEKYLRLCVESLLRQTYSNLQIILVDDGSPDRCGQICDEFARQDARVCVVHKTNGGLSDARNAGLAAATGDYFVFVDSDDWLALNYVERMLELAEKYGADIVACDFDYRKQIGQNPLQVKQERNKEIVLDHDEAMLAWLYKRYYGVSACAKMYARSCMQGVFFPEGKLHEDVGTTYKIFLQAARTVYIKEKLYCYREREDSIVNRPFDPRRLDYLVFTREIMTLMKEKYPRFYRASVSRHFQGCIQIACAMNEEDSGLMAEIQEYAPQVLSDKNSRKIYRILAAMAVLSPKITVRVARRFV